MNEDPKISLGESTELDISLVSSPEDDLWLDSWREYFDDILDDVIDFLAVDGLEDLMISCPIIVTNELDVSKDMEYDLFEDRLYVSYERKPSLVRVLEVVGERFFYSLDEENQERWLVEASEKFSIQDPRKKFSELFAKHFSSEDDLAMNPLLSLFIECTSLGD